MIVWRSDIIRPFWCIIWDTSKVCRFTNLNQCVTLISSLWFNLVGENSSSIVVFYRSHLAKLCYIGRHLIDRILDWPNPRGFTKGVRFVCLNRYVQVDQKPFGQSEIRSIQVLHIGSQFFKLCHSQPLLLDFRIFNTVDIKFVMTGFEPRTSGVRSNRSTNWATTTNWINNKTICYLNVLPLLNLNQQGGYSQQF